MRTALWLIALSAVAFGQTASTNPQLASAKAFYDRVKDIVLKSAEKMPEDKYVFKPSPDVRTYGQLVAHVADAQYFMCGAVKEGKNPSRGIEKSVTKKADLIKALQEAYAYCDSTYAGLTDATSAATQPFLGSDKTKLSILSFNTSHTFEHYGNIVTYLRINGIVPPSSEQPPPAAGKK